MPNNLDIDYLSGYFAQLLTLFEGSVLTWHHTGDAMPHACLMGQSPSQVGGHITAAGSVLLSHLWACFCQYGQIYMYKSLVVVSKLIEASQSQEAPIKIPRPNLGIEN